MNPIRLLACASLLLLTPAAAQEAVTWPQAPEGWWKELKPGYQLRFDLEGPRLPAPTITITVAGVSDEEVVTWSLDKRTDRDVTDPATIWFPFPADRVEGLERVGEETLEAAGRSWTCTHYRFKLRAQVFNVWFSPEAPALAGGMVRLSFGKEGGPAMSRTLAAIEPTGGVVESWPLPEGEWWTALQPGQWASYRYDKPGEEEAGHLKLSVAKVEGSTVTLAREQIVETMGPEGPVQGEPQHDELTVDGADTSGLFRLAGVSAKPALYLGRRTTEHGEVRVYLDGEGTQRTVELADGWLSPVFLLGSAKRKEVGGEALWLDGFGAE